MMRRMCKSKIHGAVVTEANLHYMGSLTIDRDLLEAANIVPYEWLHVVNVNTGARFETYAIEGQAGSGIIGLNGAAARLGHPGDKLIIMCAASLAEEEIADFRPRLVFVDERNHMVTPTVGDRAWDLDSLGVESEMNEAMRGE
ncbi:MAG TPA: aspartate 1-decarboxylase [Chloroflexia bacterium]|nr:aspartate 1-decarboxylase [Chloroflexia bacterium]